VRSFSIVCCRNDAEAFETVQSADNKKSLVWRYAMSCEEQLASGGLVGRRQSPWRLGSSLSGCAAQSLLIAHATELTTGLGGRRRGSVSDSDAACVAAKLHL